MMQPENYKRVKRYDIPGQAHELTFSCFKQRPFLTERPSCEYLVEAIIKAKEKHGFDIWAYVFMPEHVHLLIYPRTDEYYISRILSSIKKPVGRKILLNVRKDCPDKLKLFATGQKDAPYRFWKADGGYDRNITERETLVNVRDYIHRNPVRQGLVKDPADWYWSSYIEWEKPGEGPIPVDRGSFPVI